MSGLRRLLSGFVLLLALPAAAAPQPLVVVSPQLGQQASYRRATIRWEPMPGVTEYHLQVDDDPAFRSPEIDVVVHNPSYQLSGSDRLRLNGQLSWAAYVRVNGVRWAAPGFTPSYVSDAVWPEVAIGATGEVFYGYIAGRADPDVVMVRTSDDFSSAIRLSPAETDKNPHGIAIDVDPAGVAHAFWTEQVHGRAGLPFYANSIAWQPSQVSAEGTGGAFDVGPSMVLTPGRIEVFEEGFGPVEHFVSTDGETFTRSTVPDSSHSISAYATADVPAGALLVEERLTQTGKELFLQRSANGWTPEIIGTGRWPSAAVGSDGVVHVLGRSEQGGQVSYSNSARGFARWTPMPFEPMFGQQILPIIVDDARRRIYAAAHGGGSTLLCASDDAGESWSCRRVGGNEATHPDLKIDSTGVLHVAWGEVRGGGYATSLGSFLAVNLSPRAHLSEAVPWPNTVIIPAAVSDADGDAVSGSVAVGTNELRRSRLFRNDHLPFLGDEITFNGTTLFAINRTILFRPLGRDWTSFVGVEDLGLPAKVEVQTIEGRELGLFTIRARDSFSVTIDHWEFTAHVREPFSNGRLPVSIDVSAAPPGLLTMRVAANDGASRRVFDALFVRVEGRDHVSLVDFRPGAESFTSLLETIPADNFRAPVFRSVLGSEMNAVVLAIERALIAGDDNTRAELLAFADSRLRSRVLGRINGCATIGKPDEDDWVLDCGDQHRLRVAASQVLLAIEALR